MNVLAENITFRAWFLLVKDHLFFTPETDLFMGKNVLWLHLFKQL